MSKIHNFWVSHSTVQLALNPQEKLQEAGQFGVWRNEKRKDGKEKRLRNKATCITTQGRSTGTDKSKHNASACQSTLGLHLYRGLGSAGWLHSTPKRSSACGQDPADPQLDRPNNLRMPVETLCAPAQEGIWPENGPGEDSRQKHASLGLYSKESQNATDL